MNLTWGVWSDTETIYIKEVTTDSIKFGSGIYKLFNFDATAVLKDGEWVFGEDVSPEFSSSMRGVKGRLQFTEDTVSIIFDDFGEWGVSYSLEGRLGEYEIENYRSINGLVYSKRIYDCVSDGSANRTLGHYTVTFGNMESGYTAYTSLSVCNGGCNNDEESTLSLVAEYGTEDGWQYPVKVYNRIIEDENLKLTEPYLYSRYKRYANYVFEIGNGLHYSFSITNETGLEPYENEQEILDGMAKSAVLEYTIP